MISLFHFANLGNNFDLEIRSLDYCFRSTFSIPTGPQFNPERDVTKDISFGFGAAGCWGGLGLSVSWWGALYLTSLTPLFYHYCCFYRSITHFRCRELYLYSCSDIL